MKRYLLLLLILSCSMPVSAAKLPYTYARIGNSADLVRFTTAGTVLMGGGTDVDAAFKWMCGLSNGGDFLVIRATGTDAYNPYIRELCPGGNSVATLIVPSLTAANDARVIDIVNRAEAIWIAGGDQSNYINFWKGTKLQVALQARIDADVPIGGTSAGMNVLTQFIYTAQESKGVTSSQALADPFNRYMSFDRDFVAVPFLAGTISDPHFTTRDRMGRDLAFLCRIYDYGWSGMPRSIAVDEQTALLIDSTGYGTVVGASNAYFLEAPGAPEVCTAKTPLTYTNINVYRINNGVTAGFDLYDWTGEGGVEYSVSAIAGVLDSSQPGESPY